MSSHAVTRMYRTQLFATLCAHIVWTIKSERKQK